MKLLTKFQDQLKGITDASAEGTIKFIKDLVEAIKALAEIAWGIFCFLLFFLPIVFAISLVFKLLWYVF
jgi:hypothetical protein